MISPQAPGPSSERAYLTEEHPNLVFQFMDVRGFGGYQSIQFR